MVASFASKTLVFLANKLKVISTFKLTPMRPLVWPSTSSGVLKLMLYESFSSSNESKNDSCVSNNVSNSAEDLPAVAIDSSVAELPLILSRTPPLNGLNPKRSSDSHPER
jgi:hypothetical protein